jgi:hypothetical protein
VVTTSQRVDVKDYFPVAYLSICTAGFCMATIFDRLRRTDPIRIWADLDNPACDTFGTGPTLACTLLNFLFQFVIVAVAIVCYLFINANIMDHSPIFIMLLFNISY